LGGATDVEAALSVYERSNLARRHGVWPNRVARVEQVSGLLADPSSWLLVADDRKEIVGMALVSPLRGIGGAGPAIPGGAFLNLLYVLPERWGEGIGGRILDEVLAEARRRGCTRMVLWTDEDNERSQWLYASRGFSRTGRAAEDAAEWAREL
jgi:GNAT superfamily N-acetyltransferase